MNTDQFNHAPAELLLYTGSPRMGRPAMGSWAIYGLGSENQNLPGFVVLLSGGSNPSAGKTVWGSGFLPSVFQGVQCRSQGDPVLYLSDPKGMDRADAAAEPGRAEGPESDAGRGTRQPGDGDAHRPVRTGVPHADRGAGGHGHLAARARRRWRPTAPSRAPASFANNCLLARRLVEQGVRFVQLFDWGWDFHGTSAGIGITTGLTERCKPMDQAGGGVDQGPQGPRPVDETLVIWGGEFGRTPFREGRTAQSAILGRDHYPDCYTMFLAGGGIKPGLHLRRDGRTRLLDRARQGPRPRPAGHDPAPAWASTTSG